jgi:type IX secretion system PorP/SprF family membrane protein
MKMIKPLLLSLTLFLAGQLGAQDVHWSLFNFAPLHLNPAHTGDFNGTFRIGGIYRDQARAVSNNSAYSTPNIHVDAPLFMVGKRNWVGLGANVYSDKAGTGELTTTSAVLSAAFHAPTNRKGTSVFSFGIQGGMVNQAIDPEKYRFETDYDEDLELTQTPVFNQKMDIQDNGSYLDFGAGATIKSELNKQTGMLLGLSVRHLTTPKYGLLSNNTPDTDSTTTSYPLRVNFHGKFDFALNNKWTLSPAFAYSQMTSANNIQVQSWLGYLFNPEKEVTLNFGLGYRMGDALEALVGVDYKRFRVGASYDITLSSLNESNKTVGGFEIGLSYIAVIFKNAAVKPVIFCPRF